MNTRIENKKSIYDFTKEDEARIIISLTNGYSARKVSTDLGLKYYDVLKFAYPDKPYLWTKRPR